MTNSSRLLLAAAVFAMTAKMARSQEYPYEDNLDAAEQTRKIPTEAPEENTPVAQRRKKTRHTWALKAGINYTVLQSPSEVNPINTISTNGVGGEGLISWGMDLAYQPVFFEVETGFRSLLTTTDERLFAIPVRFGFFYRVRLGDTTLWRPGVVGGPQLRMVKNDKGGFEKAIVPIFGISSMWEFNHLIMEAVFHLNRIEKQNNFFDGSLRLGYRF